MAAGPGPWPPALGRISKLPKFTRNLLKLSVFSAAIGPRREISRPNGQIASTSEGLVPRPLSVIITFMFCDFLSVIRHKKFFDVLCKIRCPKQELHPSSCVFCVQPAGRCKHRAVIITCRKARLFWIGYPLDRANRKILQKIVGHPLLHFEVWELSLG